MRKHKSIVLALAIVLAIATAVSGATFAWFTAGDGVLNRLTSASFTGGDVQLTEIFVPIPLEPHTKVQKSVAAVNVSGTDTPAFIRISFGEALTLAKAGGQPLAQTVQYKATDLALGKIPQVFNISAYATLGKDTSTPPKTTITPKTGWVEVDDTWLAAQNGGKGIKYEVGVGSARAASTIAALNATGIQLFAKQIDTVTAAGTRTTYQFVAVAAMPEFTTDNTHALYPYNNLLQRVEPYYDKGGMTTDRGTFATDGWFDIVQADGSHDVTLYVGEWKFMAFEREDPIAKKWSTQLASLSVATPAGTGDNAWGDLDTVTSISKPAGADFVKLPEVPGYVAADNVLTADSQVDSKGYVTLIFAKDNLIADVTAALNVTMTGGVITGTDANKWVYNPDDGFFYYVGRLKPGQTTVDLLDALYLKSAAGSDYTNMVYDLNVKMQAIQSQIEAVEDTWKLTSTSTGASLLIYNALNTISG